LDQNVILDRNKTGKINHSEWDILELQLVT